MELVGPHQILGLLADLPPHGGQQLGGDGGVQDVRQHMAEGRVLLLFVPADIAHQMAHQGLGYGGVDAVHGHMVPVISGPAQGQLAEVAGAHHEAAALVGHVHEHLGALPGLPVLEGDVMVLHGLADIPEVDLHRLSDVDPLQSGPQPPGQLYGVVPGPVGGAETGHGHRDDVAGRPFQQAHGHRGDQDGQGGVQPAGQAHHHGGGPGVLDPFLQPQGGDLQDLIAALRPVPCVCGYEGGGRDIAGQGGGGALQGEGDGDDPAVRLCPEGGHPPALIGQPLHIDLRDGEPGGEAALRQQRPVLRDEVVAHEHHVGGGLPLPGVGVDIAAHQPGRLPGDQSPAVFGLAHQLVAGREVQNHRGPRLGQGHRGGRAGPQVLAQLHSQGQPGHGVAGEDHVGAQVDLLPAEGEQAAAGAGGLEPPLLIELPVVGEVGLGDQGQDLSPVYHRGAIIRFVLKTYRQAQGRHHVQALGGLQHGGKGLLRPPQQGGLEEQIPAGIAGEAQLGERQDPHPLAVRLPHQGETALGVIAAVGHPDVGRAGSDFDETITHSVQTSFGPAGSAGPDR